MNDIKKEIIHLLEQLEDAVLLQRILIILSNMTGHL